MRAFRAFSAAMIGLACGLSLACGGGSSTKTSTITTSGQNVAPIVVNAGPANNYANGAFATVTLCVPGTSTCQTIDGMLVDTGSSGVRVVSSVLTIGLTPQKGTSGNPVAECLQFLGSYTWGPVQIADVQVAGEKAASVPLQLLSDTDFTVPSACANGMPSANTVTSLGANGILGVGPAVQDCGTYCEQVQTANFNPYYECSSSASCQAVGQALGEQVSNPVSSFSTDNNGVIIELPAVSGSAATLSGSLVFGIGTQSNNALGSATIYAMDPVSFSFTTNYQGTPYSGSFIDSGSNGYFFLDSSIVPSMIDCPNTSTDSIAAFFYCPTSTQNFTATNQGTNNASGTVSFSIANAETLFSSPTATVFGDLAGPSIDGSGSSAVQPYFDWGLPFFYGRNVYTAIESANTTGGTGPYWAY
jgi:hypothetical protein